MSSLFSLLFLTFIPLITCTSTPLYQPLLQRITSHRLVSISHITHSSGYDHATPISSFSTTYHPQYLAFRMMSDTHTWNIQMERDEYVVTKDFKHVMMNKEGRVERVNTVDRSCYYRGHDSHGNLITASTCNGHLHALMIHDDEIYVIDDAIQHYHDMGLKLNHHMSQGQVHIMYRLNDVETKGNTCGVGEGHEITEHTSSHPHAAHTHSHSHAEHSLLAGECTTAPNKVVELFYFNDDKRYAMWGDQVQQQSIALFQFQQRFYNTSTFACRITLRLAGMVTLAHGNPSSLIYRPCNTADPDFINGIRDSDTINWNKCCNIARDPATNGCSTSRPVCVNMTRVYNQIPSTPACWDKRGPSYTFGSGSKITFFELSPGLTLSTKGSEIDASALLPSFAAYIQSIKSSLESTFSPAKIDHATLLSGYDFHGPVLGIAGVGAMCSTSSASIVQTTSPTAGYLASVAAHEMGHSFGCQHDSTGNACATSGFIMAASTSTNYATTWSTCSATYHNDWFTYNYGDTTHPKCLDNNINQNVVAEVVSVCGDGLVTGSEACDPSFNPGGDSCCNPSTCQLYPQCQCSNADACCVNGRIAPANSLTCRASQGACDMAEMCDGVSSKCPPDFYSAAGTTCGSGTCFQGTCVPSANDQCVAKGQVSFCQLNSKPDPCTNENGLLCRLTSDQTMCSTTSNTDAPTTAATGTPCSTSTVNGFCYQNTCTPSLSTKRYSYAVIGYTPCTSDGNLTNTIVACVDETKTTANGMCTGVAPASVTLNCSATLQPVATQAPTSAPTTSSGGNTNPTTTSPGNTTPGTTTTTPGSTSTPTTSNGGPITPAPGTTAGAQNGNSTASSAGFLDQELVLGLKGLYVIIIGGAIAVVLLLAFCCLCGCCSSKRRRYELPDPPNHIHIPMSDTKLHINVQASHQKLSVEPVSVKGPESGVWPHAQGAYYPNGALRSPSVASASDVSVAYYNYDQRGSYLSPSHGPYQQAPPTPEGVRYTPNRAPTPMNGLQEREGY